MFLIPFVTLFPEQAKTETRTLMFRNHPDLPDDNYGLIELYCSDPKCNCRRVMLNIHGERQGHLATISYAFDRDDEMAGPFLDPLNPQSQFATMLLSLVTQVLENPAYVARLEAHYYQVKGITTSPTPAIQRLLLKWGGGGPSTPPRAKNSSRKRPRRRKR